MQGHRCVNVDATGCGFDPPSMEWNICIFISSLWCRGSARRWVSPLNKLYLQNLTENGEWSVLTLCSLCLAIFIIYRNIRVRELYIKFHYNELYSLWKFIFYRFFSRLLRESTVEHSETSLLLWYFNKKYIYYKLKLFHLKIYLNNVLKHKY